MQTNSRIFKAARRTIRAELTLILVIVLIGSWSVYALYRFSIGGSESILGLSFSRPNQEAKNKQAPRDAVLPPPADSDQISKDHLNALYKRHMIEEFLAGQRDLRHQFDARIARESRGQKGASNKRRLWEDRSPNHRVPAESFLNLSKIRSPLSHSKGRESAQENETSNLLDRSETKDVDSSVPESPSESNHEPEPSEETETSTESPSSDDQSEQQSQSGERDEPDESQEEPEQKGPDEPTRGDSSEDDQVEAAREEGNAIDEEVDRMTQPSSSNLSRHKPQVVPSPDYNKNVVHFDDGLSSGSVSSSTNKLLGDKLGSPGDLIARFEDPAANLIQSNNTKVKRSKSVRKHNQDLEVDHNKSDAAHIDAQAKEVHNKTLRVEKSENNTHGHMLEDWKRSKSNSTSQTGSRRHKRGAISKTRIMEPHDPKLETFFDSIHFDKLLAEASFESPTISNKSLDQDQMSQVSSDNYERLNQTESESLDIRYPKDGDGVSNKSSLRREDDDGASEDNEINNEDDADANPAVMEDMQSDLNDLTKQPLADSEEPKYHYISSNDSSLRDLLNHHQLLDDRRYNLPPPYKTIDLKQPADIVQSIPVPHQAGPDHQTAGSLYTVDHGLLLYPSDDHEHHHKHKGSSVSKKKKKHEKMKHKKKSTVGMKKGGHKKKKHKKEEKKYIKEKKFKGAKKGKKVKKGKGGQGGKKGKKLYKDKGFKKKGFKNVYHKEEFGQKKSYFDEFRDKDFKKKWKKYDDKYNYAQMKKWQAKDVKGAKKMKNSGKKFKKYDKSKWKKKYEKHSKEHKSSLKKKKKKKESHDFK